MFSSRTSYLNRTFYFVSCLHHIGFKTPILANSVVEHKNNVIAPDTSWKIEFVPLTTHGKDEKMCVRTKNAA